MIDCFPCHWYYYCCGIALGEFLSCGFYLAQPHFRVNLSGNPKVTLTSPLFSLKLKWENSPVLRQVRKVCSLRISRGTRRCSGAGGQEPGSLLKYCWSREHWTCLPAKTNRSHCSLSAPEEAAAGSLPLVNVSLFTPLTPTEMAPYMKRLSRGQTVEGK